jgi:NAD(P)-dependent dehydrogenase (short-subunit alcohol dehydrogenase family)
VIIEGKSLLITGANRGIGRALVQEALNRGATRVYAGHRKPVIDRNRDDRIIPVRLDITDPRQITAAADRISQLDLLVNNAGIVAYDDLSEQRVLEEMLAVNLHGTLNVTRGLLPHLIASGGAIVNNISVNAFAAFPLVPSYSVSKAALFNATQALRAILATSDVSVHAVLTGLVDTDMTAGFDVDKAPPAQVAAGIFDGVERGEEDIFPDPMAQPLADGWRTGPGKNLESQYAAMYAHFS